MGAHEHRVSLRVVFQEEVLQPPLVDRVEVDERLVQEEEVRAVQERGGEHELLARALRKVSADGPPRAREVEEGDPSIDRLLEVGDVPNAADEVQVLRGRQVGWR